VGLPQRQHTRLRTAIDRWAGERGAVIRHVPSAHPKLATIDGIPWDEVNRNIQDGFTRLVLPASMRDVPSIVREHRYGPRTIVLRLGEFPSQAIAQLDAMLDFEITWRERLEPKDRNSPLHLPTPSFEPADVIGDYWAAANCYGDQSAISLAEAGIARVLAEHRRTEVGVGVYWVDRMRRRFAVDKSYHSRAVTERAGRSSIRFCYSRPAVFHFDVTGDREKPFSIWLVGGRQQRATRMNISAWAEEIT
jgi:hypothetical protein